jgi:hypothetical protein
MMRSGFHLYTVVRGLWVLIFLIISVYIPEIQFHSVFSGAGP